MLVRSALPESCRQGYERRRVYHGAERRPGRRRANAALYVWPDVAAVYFLSALPLAAPCAAPRGDRVTERGLLGLSAACLGVALVLPGVAASSRNMPECPRTFLVRRCARSHGGSATRRLRRPSWLGQVSSLAPNADGRSIHRQPPDCSQWQPCCCSRRPISTLGAGTMRLICKACWNSLGSVRRRH